jgi:hypothetical protein
MAGGVNFYPKPAPGLLEDEDQGPSKWAQTWEILSPYVTGPANAVKGLMDADLNTLLYDTGPAGRQAVENSFDAAGFATAGSAAAPKPRGALTMGVKAYHGSPHDFDRFDMSKIGTGEGAQAYGHGLYFAQAEDVARSYKAAGQPSYLGQDRIKAAQDILQQAGGDRSAALALADQNMRGTTKYSEAKLWQDVVNNFDDLSAKTPGKMYEVNINADPDTFLDWDKPLSEQPEAVRKALKQLDIPTGSMSAKDRVETLEAAMSGDPRLAHLLKQGGINITGDTVYRGLSDSLGAVDWPVTADAATRAQYRSKGAAGATDKLREAGIPGIKYLDAGSRGAGDGTRNYVVFDDKLIEILRKYGIAGLLGGGTAAGAMMSEPQGEYQ